MPILPEAFRRLGNVFAVALIVFALAAPPAQAGSQEDALAAALRGNSGTLSKLLKNGRVSPNTVDEHGNSLLILAARDGHIEAVKVVLSFRPQVDHRNKTGDSALMLAASKGNMQLLDLLLANGAKTNPVPGENVWTALHYAALEGKLPAVDRL
ncbi:MAG: ankyrin repeat domain-containing protein, partial [Azoarcus sp.]|nr:ankyrin repeat domain-containing protein [Azoarcus sp.]